MAKAARVPEDFDNVIPIRPPPARTRVRRTQQLVMHAENLLEERLINKTASPTEVIAVMRLGTAIEEANVARIQAQTEYLKAQRAKAESETVREEMFSKAMEAMSRYSGEDHYEPGL